MGPYSKIDHAPSPVSSNGDTADLDDEFEISLTESYLRRVVHTRPHTHIPHTYKAREPDLLLPEKLEQFARSKGIMRSALPVPVNNDPLNAFPFFSIPDPITQNQNIPSTKSGPKLNTSSRSHRDIQPRSSSSDTRAVMHADRLWAEHRFNHLDLTIEPKYLTTTPENAFEAAIQVELCTLWKNALAKRLLRLEEQCVGVTFTRSFRQMQDILDHLRRRILQLGQAVEVLKAGVVVDFEAMKKKQANQQHQGPQKGSKPLQQVSKQGTPKSYVLQRSNEPNCGFGASTTIIRFQKEGEAASEKEVGEVIESIEGTRSEARRNIVSQTKKKAAEVIDLNAPQTPVPQSKKRPAGVIDLEQEADEVRQAKKAKTNAFGDGSGEQQMVL
jgi:hypothetical protein